MDYVRRAGGLRKQLHGNKPQTRKPELKGEIGFFFELGDIKYNRSGNTVVQLIIPYEFGEVNLLLQRAIGLTLHAKISQIPADELAEWLAKDNVQT